MSIHDIHKNQFQTLAVDVTSRAKSYPDFKSYLLAELAKDGIYSVNPYNPCTSSLTLNLNQTICDTPCVSPGEISCNTTLCVTNDYKTNCSTAQSNLTTCQNNLVVSQNNATTHAANYSSCQSNLTVTALNLTTCQSNLTATNSSLIACQTNFITASGNLSTCQNNLTASQNNASTLAANYSTCQNLLNSTQNSASACQQAYKNLSSIPLLLKKAYTFAQNYTDFATKFHNSLLICGFVEPSDGDAKMEWKPNASAVFYIGDLFFNALNQLLKQPSSDTRYCPYILYQMWESGSAFYNTTCADQFNQAMNPLPDDIKMPLAKEICVDASPATSSFFSDFKNNLAMCSLIDAYGEDQTWHDTSTHIGSDFAFAIENLMYNFTTICNANKLVFEASCCVQHLYLMWKNTPAIYDNTTCNNNFNNRFSLPDEIRGPIAKELCADAPNSSSRFFTQLDKSIQLCAMNDESSESSIWKDGQQIGTDINGMLYNLATSVPTTDLSLANDTQNSQFCLYNLFQFYNYTVLQHNYSSFPYCLPLLSGLIAAPYYGALCEEVCECGLTST